MTPDEDFIIDELDGEHAGIVVACGFSGHGFKFGPLIGAWLAAMASGRGADASVEALGPGVIVAEARAAFSLSRAALRLRKGAA
jgi:glycine/D-amino acid oxidase-like deaminating enzyme